MNLSMERKKQGKSIIEKILFIGLLIEFISTFFIFMFFTDIYLMLDTIINGLMILNVVLFILSLVMFKYNKKSGIIYTIISLIFFLFSNKSTYSIIFVLLLGVEGK